MTYGAAGALIAATVGGGLGAGLSGLDLMLVVGPIAAAILLAATVSDAFGLYCLTLAWLPFSAGFLQIEIGVVTFNPYLFGMLGLVLVVGARILLGGLKRMFTARDLLVLALGCAFLFSTLQAPDLMEAGFLGFHALFVPIVSYFVARGMVRTEEEYRIAWRFFLVGLVAFGIVGIVEYTAVQGRTHVVSVPPIGAATLLIVAVLGLFLLKSWHWAIRWSALAASSAALVLTFSRTYLVALLVAPVLWYWIRRGGAGYLVGVLIVGTLAATLLVTHNAEWFRPTAYDKNAEYSAERITSMDFWKGSIYGRALAFQAGLEEFERHPIAGGGLRKGEKMVTQHNFHIEWLEYGGLIGYALYAAVFVAHFFAMRRLARVDRFCAANLLIISLIVMNAVTNGFMHGLMPYVAFLLMGLNETRRRILAQQARVERRRFAPGGAFAEAL